MSPLKTIAAWSTVFLCATAPFAKGITVRFLANPPEDSLAGYAVLRSDGPGLAPRELGVVASLPGRDTLAFADSGAIRGKAYLYSIVGIDPAGARSEPSESTYVALPALALPDTLRADSSGARVRLPLGADPLSGIVPLSITSADTARASLAFDAATRDLVVKPRAGAASGWVVLRATYFGKFEARDSLWLSLETPRPGAALVGPAAAGADAFALPAAWSPARGPLRIPGGTGLSRLDVLDIRGSVVAEVPLSGNGSEVTWDGHDRFGHPLPPAQYMWVAAGKRARHRSGRLRILH